MKGGEAEAAKDFANYFCSYAYLYHQKQMLTDHHRMQSYHSSIMRNKVLFQVFGPITITTFPVFFDFGMFYKG